jgi:hypothetical protein
MQLPFGVDQFFALFGEYNRAVWPAQPVLVLLGLLLVLLAWRRSAMSTRWVGWGLGLLWVWTGAVYHLVFFRRINPAAIAFGTLFLVQAALFVVWGLRSNETPAPLSRSGRWVGAAILIYAFIIYPALGWQLGHRYPYSPTFGVPCPTTIATFGLLIWATSRPRWWLLVVPLLWAAVGSSAALMLGVTEDFGLPAAAIVASAWWTYQALHRPRVLTA